MVTLIHRFGRAHSNHSCDLFDQHIPNPKCNCSSRSTLREVRCPPWFWLCGECLLSIATTITGSSKILLSRLISWSHIPRIYMVVCPGRSATEVHSVQARHLVMKCSLVPRKAGRACLLILSTSLLSKILIRDIVLGNNMPASSHIRCAENCDDRDQSYLAFGRRDHYHLKSIYFTALAHLPSALT